MSSEVIDFVRANPNVLDPPVGNLEAGRVYPSRRSWVSCDESLKSLNLYAGGREGLLTQVVKGWLGSEIAAMFQKFVQNEFSRINAADILDKWEEVKDRVEASCADIEVIAAHASAVVAELKRRPAKKITDVQKAALKEFFMVLPADVTSSIWVELLGDNKTKKIVAPWRNDAELRKKLNQTYLNG